MTDISWNDKVQGSTGDTGRLTAANCNEIKTAVNSKIDADPNIDDPNVNLWQGKTATGIAGESMTPDNYWDVLYCKDTGSGTRFYLYDANGADADTYSPISLLASNGTYAAGDEITVTVGDGILSNTAWGALEANVGKAVYCSTTAGDVTYTRPSSTGDHAKQIATLLNIAANGQNVWDVSFRYLDWKIE